MEPRLKPSPHQITAFTESARQRSFSAAAKVLGVTQSSITQHVAKLEGLVGTQLFTRQRDGLVLTKAGRSLFDLTDQMRSLEESVYEHLTRFGSLKAGYLRIIANAPRPALKYIAAFNRQHPGIEVSLSLGTWEHLSESLRNRDCDLAFMTDPPTNHGLETRVITHVPYRAYLPVSHPLASCGGLRLKALVDEVLIVPEDGSLTQRIVRQSFAAAGLPLPRFLKAGTFPLVKEAILHGGGVGIMLEDSVYDDPRLVGLAIKGMNQRYSIHLMTQPERRNLRMISRFYDLCAEQADA
ncbi:MAG: LysR family transcriptional regulator [Pseudomonadota bacterium]